MKILNFDDTISEIEDGKNIFRKHAYNDIELEICELLQINPHENIVTILEVNKEEKYIDMEILDVNEDLLEVNDYDEIIKGKEHLHKLGISYIDWKVDNLGYSTSKKKMKIFDFNCSGLFDVNEKKNLVKKPYY